MEKIQIYYAWGGYDIFPPHNAAAILDLKIDESGTPYVFYTVQTIDGNTQAICYKLTNGTPECVKEETFNTCFSNDGKEGHGAYLGYYADIPSMVSLSTKYSASIIQGVPYLTITGLSKNNGVNVRYTIDLINGTDNSSFAQDGRNVVSFFRIN